MENVAVILYRLNVSVIFYASIAQQRVIVTKDGVFYSSVAYVDYKVIHLCVLNDSTSEQNDNNKLQSEQTQSLESTQQ